MSLGMMSSRDWNEELQSARELPQANVHEKIVRDRTIFRVSHILQESQVTYLLLQLLSLLNSGFLMG